MRPTAARADTREGTRGGSGPPPLPVDPPTTPLRPLDLPALPAEPPAAFVRRASRSATASSTVPPVSLSSGPEPTIVVVRERPRAAWFIGAGLLGAACALVAVRFVTSGRASALSGDHAPPAVAAVSPVETPAPSVAPVAPVAEPVVSTVGSGTASGPAVVVHFAADQGVAIVASPVSPSPVSPAPAPRPAPRAAPTPESAAKKRALLTTEQQLADAQLKASMR